MSGCDDDDDDDNFYFIIIIIIIIIITCICQYNFSGCLMDAETSMGRRKEKDYQTRNRLDHGRGTHFVLGYDRADYNSEHVHNFQGKTQPAVELPPAGKKEHKPSTRFNHFYHR